MWNQLSYVTDLYFISLEHDLWTLLDTGLMIINVFKGESYVNSSFMT